MITNVQTNTILGVLIFERNEIIMNQNVIELFKINIYCCDININLEQLKNNILNIRKKDQKGRLLSNIGGWQSNLLNDIGEVREHIEDHSLKYLNELGLSASNKVDVCWANINGYKDTNAWHTHPKSVISGVFYVDANEKSGNLKFFNPYINEISREWADHIKNFNPMNDVDTEIMPRSGLLILFPSFLPHSVNPNLSEEERISISFNI